MPRYLARIVEMLSEAGCRGLRIEIKSPMKRGQQLDARDLAGKLVHNVVFGPIGEIMNENDRPRLSAEQCLHTTGHPEAAVNQAGIHIRRGDK